MYYFSFNSRSTRSRSASTIMATSWSKLTRGCQTALKEAEQKVEILLKSAGGEDLEDFEVDEDS